jgi:hypothetical protein
MLPKLIKPLSPKNGPGQLLALCKGFKLRKQNNAFDSSLNTFDLT